MAYRIDQNQVNLTGIENLEELVETLSFLPKAGGLITGNLSASGNLTLVGDILSSGVVLIDESGRLYLGDYDSGYFQGSGSGSLIVINNPSSNSNIWITNFIGDNASSLGIYSGLFQIHNGAPVFGTGLEQDDSSFAFISNGEEVASFSATRLSFNNLIIKDCGVTISTEAGYVTTGQSGVTISDSGVGAIFCEAVITGASFARTLMAGASVDRLGLAEITYMADDSSSTGGYLSFSANSGIGCISHAWANDEYTGAWGASTSGFGYKVTKTTFPQITEKDFLFFSGNAYVELTGYSGIITGGHFSAGVFITPENLTGVRFIMGNHQSTSIGEEGWIIYSSGSSVRAKTTSVNQGENIICPISMNTGQTYAVFYSFIFGGGTMLDVFYKDASGTLVSASISGSQIFTDPPGTLFTYEVCLGDEPNTADGSIIKFYGVMRDFFIGSGLTPDSYKTGIAASGRISDFGYLTNFDMVPMHEGAGSTVTGISTTHTITNGIWI